MVLHSQQVLEPIGRDLQGPRQPGAQSGLRLASARLPLAHGSRVHLEPFSEILLVNPTGSGASDTLRALLGAPG